MHDNIIVPLRRGQSFKAASLSTDSTTIGSAVSQDNTNSSIATRSHSFMGCAFEIKSLFPNREIIVSQIIPNKFKEIQAYEFLAKVAKERLQARIKSQKMNKYKSEPLDSAALERTLRHLIIGNNKLHRGSSTGIVLPLVSNHLSEIQQ